MGGRALDAPTAINLLRHHAAARKARLGLSEGNTLQQVRPATRVRSGGAAGGAWVVAGVVVSSQGAPTACIAGLGRRRSQTMPHRSPPKSTIEDIPRPVLREPNATVKSSAPGCRGACWCGLGSVYGRFAPRSDERDRWERLDEHSNEMGTVAGTTPEATENAKARKPLGSHALESSRGGTRTRDPGIMSAVL